MLILASEILLVPYIAWGFYLLRRRLRHHDEIAPKTLGLTVLGVTIFFVVEMAVLETVLRDSLLIYIFATLGLLVSCAALYGHVLVSLLSWLLVDFFLPAEVREGDRPRMGPAEALERYGNYEEALEGYRVLARIYPNDAEIALRIAENLGRLGRGDEAGQWITRAMAHAHSASEEFDLVSRACEVLERHLERHEKARELLCAYLERHPRGDESARALERLAQIGTAKAVMQSESLAALAGNPLAAQGIVEERSRGHKKVKLGVARVDSALETDAPEPHEEDAPLITQAPGITLTPLGLGESLTPIDDEEERRPHRINRLRLEGKEESPNH